MSSLSSYREGKTRLCYTDMAGKRKTIHLGTISKRNALAIQLRVDELLACMFCGTSPDRNTLEWVASISVGLRTKLAHHGLIDAGNLPVKVKAISITDFLKSYIEKRGEGMKPGTITVWETNAQCLIDHLPDLPIQKINVGHAKDWLDKLKAINLAPSTIYKRIASARQFFHYAVDHKLIPSNPFESLSMSRPKPKHNVEVPREWITKLFLKCDPTWKAIVSLSRFGGLRCPSEVLSLKWADVDFERGTMAIPEPKVEHHDGRGVRLCPLFPEVRQVLETLERSGEYVIDKQTYRDAANTGVGWKNANLRTQFIKQLKAAGLEPWKRLFHSMRASRQTEVEREFGLPAACAWLGNTEEVARESYLIVFAEEWKKAVGGAAQIVAQKAPESKGKPRKKKPAGQ